MTDAARPSQLETLEHDDHARVDSVPEGSHGDLPQSGHGVMTTMHDEDDMEDGNPDEPDEDEICADCQRIGSHWDMCGLCGAAMCFACFEMGCGVCKGPHK